MRCPKCKSKDLVVTARLCNHSAFNGYRYTPSRYSAVECRECRYWWRSKSPNVANIPDASEYSLS